MNTAIEQGELDVPLTIDPDDDVDQCFAEAAYVTLCVTETLSALQVRAKSDTPLPDVVTREYATELVEAFHAGRRLVEHDRREELMHDMTECDPEFLVELRATIGYVAPHYGVHIDFPAPGGDDQ